MKKYTPVCDRCIRDAGVHSKLTTKQIWDAEIAMGWEHTQSYCAVCKLYTYPIIPITQDFVSIIIETQRLDSVLKHGGWIEIDGEKCFTQKLLGVWHYWSPETGWHKYDKSVDTNRELCHTVEN
jgi:hypothetical protein